MKIIAKIYTEFDEKFGIPRQSGISDADRSVIIFEKEYRDENALRGIDGFSHLWLIWHFSEVKQENWSPTVRPPRLGGNTRMGVFATRSPFRPNPIGLSAVRIVGIDLHTPEGPVITVAGADLMDGTPIFDLKPYIAYADSHPDAKGGFIEGLTDRSVQVVCDEAHLSPLPDETRQSLLAVLAHDPRPTYQNDPSRVYGMEFGGFNVRFTVAEGVLTVVEIG